jgi:hypothetical protein
MPTPTHDPSDDVWTARDRGLSSGYLTADWIGCGRLVATDDDEEPVSPYEFLRSLAADQPRIPLGLAEMIMHKSGMVEQLAESDEPDAGIAFWRGFRDGVRAGVVELLAEHDAQDDIE